MISHRVLDPASAPEIPAGLCALAVMTKAPRAGKVKTRLTPPLTPQEAADLNICFLQDTALALSTAAAKSHARAIAVYTPVGEEAAYEGILPVDFALIPQRGDGFGERLTCAAEDLLRLGFASVCLIDSDSPTVPETAFSQAATLLSERGDCIVLGPSHDGGYYLIGMKKLHPELFEKIDWSTERVLEQTIDRAERDGLTVHLLPAWYDIDDKRTLSRLCEDFFAANGNATTGYPAPATRGYLAALIKREGRERIWPNESTP